MVGELTNHRAGCGAALLMCAILVVQLEAADYYFDANDSAAGFGSPTGTYSSLSPWWNPSSAGTGTVVTWPVGNTITFGSVASDLAGCTFTYSMDGGNNIGFAGLTVNSTGAVITLAGAANYYMTGGQTWTVPAGSVLNENAQWPSDVGSLPGMNFNGAAVTLTGGGTINFLSAIGNNDGNTVTENGAGLVVNLHAPGNPKRNQAGYTLAVGKLNFASASASNAFQAMASGRSLTINGGTIDNTSGEALTLSLGSGVVNIGGSFTFTGSSSLNIGTSTVTLTTSPVITVHSNVFAMGPTFGSYGITKAGAGAVALSGSNGYSGASTVNNGTFAIDGMLGKANVVTVNSGGYFGGTGTVAGLVTVNSGGGISPGLTNTIGTLNLSTSPVIYANSYLHVNVSPCGTCDLLNVNGELAVTGLIVRVADAGQLAKSNTYVIAQSTLPLSGEVAGAVNLPRYEWKVLCIDKQLRIVPLQQGTRIMIR